MNKGFSIASAIILTALVMAIAAGGAIYLLNQKNQEENDKLSVQVKSLKNQISNLETPAATVSPTPTSSATPTPTATEDTSWKKYTNAKYGFTLSFGDAWKGYKVKEAQVVGITDVYYFTVPTTDAAWNDTTTSFPGYTSVFAVSVYTTAQWNTALASGGPTDTKIDSKGDLVFTYSSAQALPQDIQSKGLMSQIKQIINTFTIAK